MIYGHKWTSSFGEKDDGTWLKGLSDVSVEQIKHGLEKIRVSDEGWPPSLPEFRTLCLVAHAEQVRKPYRPDRSLPWSNCSKDVAERELAKMKKVVHGDPEAE